jgi:long-chain-alcohol oxidase
MTSAATARGTGSAAGQPAARVVAAVAAGLLGPGYHPEVPGRVLALLERTPARRDRDQLLGVLRMLDSRAGALALTGRPVPVSGLPPAAAEALVQRWWRRRLPLQRRLAAALSGVTMLAGYGWPGPARDATGYPGPLGAAPDVPRKLTPLELAGDQELACDVVIVGSGAGGGVAAAELARRGLDVVVLEKGGYAAERDFHHAEGDAYQELYLYGLTLTTDDLACRILAGSTLGGGTVVNFTT